MSRVACTIAIAAAALALGADATARPLDNGEPIPYFIAAGADSKPHPAAPFARWAFATWAKASSGALRFVETDNETSALVRVYWAGPSNSLYGEMRAIEVNGQPGAEVYVHTATDVLGADIARRARTDRLFRDTIVFLTCVHEIGHALGLRHTDAFSDIMYSFQYGGDIERYFLRYRNRLQRRRHMRARSPLSKADIARLRMLY